MVVVGHGVDGVRLDDHPVGEVAHEQGEEGAEDDEGVGEATTQGDAAQGVVGSGGGCCGCVGAGCGRGRVGAGAGETVGAAGAGAHVRHLLAQAGSVVAAHQKQAHGDEVGHQGAAALADEGQGDAGQGHQPSDAAHDDEGLQYHHGGEARGHEGGHIGAGPGGGDEAPDAEGHIEHEDPSSAQKAGLFGDGGEDEVALHHGNQVAEALPDAGAQHAAVGQGVGGLAELVARVQGVGEGVQPGGHPDLHVGETGVEEDGGGQGKDARDDEVGLAAAGHVEHGQEDAEEHEGAAQVLLEDDHQKGQAPHEEHGQQGAEVRYSQMPDAGGEHREHSAVLGQVARQEDDEADLRHFAGLEGKRP